MGILFPVCLQLCALPWIERPLLSGTHKLHSFSYSHGSSECLESGLKVKASAGLEATLKLLKVPDISNCPSQKFNCMEMSGRWGETGSHRKQGALEPHCLRASLVSVDSEKEIHLQSVARLRIDSCGVGRSLEERRSIHSCL